MPLPTPADASTALRALAERWRASTLGEKQAFQHWFLEFCDALGVDRPSPNAADDYCFEKSVALQRHDLTDGVGRIDCWKAGHFAVEAKGTGSKGSSEIHLRRAFKQVSDYVAAEPGTVPPYLMVVDVPRELIIWEGWRGGFGGFAAGRRILLDQLPDRPDDIALLQDIFAQPKFRDPRGKAQQVTRDTAGKLAELAAALEDRGHDPEKVARFLMRCVFCCFAEDVGLLPKKLFERTLKTARDTGDSAHVTETITALWRVMDAGGMFGADKIQKFNGHFFRALESLPLEPADVHLLIEAAGFEWSGVEPSIFGTLLVRALEPAERHRLGAEYTPREYIERLVEPTVVEPLRERWSAVQARVTQLEGSGKKKDLQEAVQEVRSYHVWLRSLRFLDPACGSGNFLYVTMAAVKRIELEVLRELERLNRKEGTEQTEQILDEVHPRQFHGIEVNWWAREIAELTLWIGYHQFWREAHGERAPKEPILEDTGTIECRDAILVWDAKVHRPEKDLPDPTPRIVDPVTGELVPHPAATLPYMEYLGARQAEWPDADFIVGNPPYIGNKRLKLALGDGYVDALRAAYPDLGDGVDLVMYWWCRVASLVGGGSTIQAGLITTNSITQSSNSSAAARAMGSSARVIWAVPDHPWVDEAEGAAVRVAMTVVAREGNSLARHVTVDDEATVTSVRTVLRLNSDLTALVDVGGAASVPLHAARGISYRGYNVVGRGFVLEPDEGARLLMDSSNEPVVKAYLNGRDLAQRSRNSLIIDFGMLEEPDARSYPGPFQLVMDRVRPERLRSRDKGFRETWWRFGRPRPALREASLGLTRLVATPYVARTRFFTFLDTKVAPDDTLVLIAVDDSFVLGILSSSIHIHWAAAAGTRLGIGNDGRYNNPRCFDAYPFPDPSPELRDTIGALAERLDQHRKDAIARDERVTMTGMYNVVDKLRSGETLSLQERVVHEVAACGILRDMHDALDALVAEAYGWPWPMAKEEILERLVHLHGERVAEEKRGVIRWLRPEYQIPRFEPGHVAAELELPAGEALESPVEVSFIQWPGTAVEQLAALQALVGKSPLTLEQAVAAFAGGDRKLVGRHLETLAMLGEVREVGGRFGG
jgi:hypothetical protein